MSQVEPCYFYANPPLLLCSITRTISLRLPRWNENTNVWAGTKSSRVVSCNAEDFSSGFLCSFTTLDPRRETRRQVQDSSADQAGSRTTSVSPSTTALSLTGGGNTSSPTHTFASSSSEEPTPTPFSSTLTSVSAKTSSSSETSISTESATTETVYSSTRFSITIRGTSSSVSTWANPTSSLDPPQPQSPSSTQTISISPTSSRTTTETFTPEPSTSFSSQEPRMSSSFSDSSGASSSSSWSGSPTFDPSTSSAPPAMSSLTPNSSNSDSSSIPLTTVFSSTLITITSTSVIVLPLPTSISPSSTPSTTTDTEPPTLSSDSLPSTSSTNPIPLPTTLTSTKFVTIFTDGGTSTSSSVVGVLRTDAPAQSNFARNTGAVIAVSLSVAVAIILAVLVTFFACKRYRSRNKSSGSMENILALAREVSWRRPVDGEDDDSIIDGYGGSHSPPQNRTLGRRSHSEEGGPDGFGGAVDQLSAEVGGHGSAESSNAGMAPPLHPTFGGQPYMPGYGQTTRTLVGQPNANVPRYTSATGPDSSQTWLGINNPQAYYEGSGGQNHLSPGGSRSAVSLTLAGSSSGGHGSSSGEGSRARPHIRVSLTGPRPIHPSNDGRRHNSAPPTAFMGAREPVFDYERQHHPEQSDKGSVRSFLSRLRNGRRTSTQSLSTVRGGRSHLTRGSKESLISHEPSNLYSPSLLNPPVTIPPSRAILRFPRGVTGNSYAPMPPEMSERYTSAPASGLWPPVTLPPPPSPVPTDNSSMVEGLLHPRLGSGTDHLQASTASLRDHEDYTRPINGLVNNHIRSTTTFEILDTHGPPEEGPMAR